MKSKASNGHSQAQTPGEVPLAQSRPVQPIPTRAKVHCLALLPELSEDRPLAVTLRTFLLHLQERIPALDPVDPTQFSLVDRPRTCMFTRVTAGPWAWHILIDPQGMPSEVQEAVSACKLSPELDELVREHRLSVMIFLLEAPEDASPMERFRALCQVAWAWIDSGATVLSFPEGRAACPRRLLLGLEPEQIDAEHAYLFLSNGVAHQEKGKTWLRTWGMAQFCLPDLAAGLDTETLQAPQLESLRLLFETLPPAMVREHGVLPVGGTVQVGERVWSAVGPPGPGELPFMISRFGFQLFV